MEFLADSIVHFNSILLLLFFNFLGLLEGEKEQEKEFGVEQV